MDSRPLNTHVSFIHDCFDFIVENELDASLQHYTKVHTLGSVHDVDVVRCIAGCGEIDNSAVNSGLIDEANFLTVDVDKWRLRFRRDAIGLVEVGKPWDDPSGRIALRVERVGRSQHSIGRYDCLAVVVMAWVFCPSISITGKRDIR